MKIAKALLVLAVLTSPLFTTTARADEVADWNRNLFEAARLNSPPTNAFVASRNAAMVQAAVFDAVNGIERRYTPVHVEPAAPRGASTRAAVVQAAYAVLIRLYPTQAVALLAKRDASLAAIAHGHGNGNDKVLDSTRRGESQRSIVLGIAWGQTVADAIWAWRLTDGFNAVLPPFFGGDNVGQWRSTALPPAAGVGLVFAYMTPWVIASRSQFRPVGPPALTSARYTADFNETKLKGNMFSTSRTADESLFSRFWNVSTASAYWNQIALTLAERHKFSLSENARLLAFLNLAVGDAAIGCWDAKYTYAFWRPVTAIPLANTDGNPDTIDGPYTTFLPTPNHPEYPSGHSCLSGAAGRVLASSFGERTRFSVNSDAPEMAGVIRSYRSFTDILNEIKDARVFAGIHFRSACDVGQGVGIGVADYVRANALQRVHGNDDNDEHGR